MAQSPTGSPGGSPGRPSLWTPSAERKMIRLYVYTTLSLDTINRLVHIRQPEAGPGVDSANRKLRSLLDKEPRWLHPRDESDMSRRLNELSNSPTRLTAADCSSSDSSGSFLGPHDSASPMSIRSEHRSHPLHSWTRSSASPSNPNDGAVFVPFLRQTTCLSTSTDATTGSYRQILHDHSEPYVLAVKRLVKRFTAPFVALHSSTPEMMTPSSWHLFCDAYPLPRYLLYRDVFILGGDLDLVSPWVASNGITFVGQRICVFGPTHSDFVDRDSVGNTALHFIAAHGSLELLLRTLRSGLADAVARERNTAGQYFLHAINNESMQDVHRLQQLLLLASGRGVDVNARDVYGRTIFHMVRLSGHGPDTVVRLASPFHGPGSSRRDAFGLVPTVASAASADLEPTAEEPDINAHRRRLETISLALQNPSVEDDRGRNGLHCLAAGALSAASVAQRCDIDMCPNIPTHLDSASETFRLRHEFARGLLEAGVDPNHYDLAGNTPLMTFAAELPEDDDYRTGPAMMELLIRQGADVKARNRAGETALHIAVRKGRKLAVRVLVHNGASVHVHDAQGRSLLDVADAMTRHACGSGKDYAHFEACRAWLSGDAGKAVQRPSLLDEWSQAR
ncbi:hypothetical protein L249_3212 [Ophiocordyceps polyrhachis-furcata BCC 54312]|uniref:Clr5 domain-containing protein n=1 Tax=Ophiocordyceps polyrhachis-furcata BCC 54312 TaxID=1330021 RepID=A0A367LNV1_9HYPO|nr:hypothetical protein L249_3212 [Ophiocordyceps polyrhachis-furcata BCC 54312]